MRPAGANALGNRACMCAMTSVLVLGDGNLSFSMALSQLIEDMTGTSLLATTFDSDAVMAVRFSLR